MRGAVEAVLADAVRLRELGVDGVGVGLRRQGGEERGVEDGDVRHVRQRLAGRLDAGDARRVVQRCERAELAQLLQHPVIDHDR